jgi:hypothetical protein
MNWHRMDAGLMQLLPVFQILFGFSLIGFPLMLISVFLPWKR